MEQEGPATAASVMNGTYRAAMRLAFPDAEDNGDLPNIDLQYSILVEALKRELVTASHAIVEKVAERSARRVLQHLGVPMSKRRRTGRDDCDSGASSPDDDRQRSFSKKRAKYNKKENTTESDDNLNEGKICLKP